MFVIPIFLGQPLYLWVGMVVGSLVVFQIVIGKKWIKVPFVWHRRNGWLILFVGLIHGLLAFAHYVLGVPVQTV